MRRRFPPSWLASSLLLTLGFLSPASAEDAKAASTASSERPSTQYLAKLQDGIRLLAGKDVDAAEAALREALELDPSRPEAHYYLGSARQTSGRIDQALESFRTCNELAEAREDGLYRTRSLVAIAGALELKAVARTGRESANRPDIPALERAREAWGALERFAQADGSERSRGLARARIDAIVRVIEQDRAYEEVRRRIEAREKEKAEAAKKGGKSRPASAR